MSTATSEPWPIGCLVTFVATPCHSTPACVWSTKVKAIPQTITPVIQDAENVIKKRKEIIIMYTVTVTCHKKPITKRNQCTPSSKMHITMLCFRQLLLHCTRTGVPWAQKLRWPLLASELPHVSSFIPVVVQNTILPVLSSVKNSIPQCFLSLPSTFLKNIWVLSKNDVTQHDTTRHRPSPLPQHCDKPFEANCAFNS